MHMLVYDVRSSWRSMTSSSVFASGGGRAAAGDERGPRRGRRGAGGRTCDEDGAGPGVITPGRGEPRCHPPLVPAHEPAASIYFFYLGSQ